MQESHNMFHNFTWTQAVNEHMLCEKKVSKNK